MSFLLHFKGTFRPALHVPVETKLINVMSREYTALSRDASSSKTSPGSLTQETANINPPRECVPSSKDKVMSNLKRSLDLA